MAQFRFVIRSGPNVGRTYLLEGEELSIGRDTSNKISINDSEVSRKHARLLWQGDGYLLEDFGSTNGTFVNGQRLSGSTPLKIGDLVALGETVAMIYESDFDADATMMSSKSKSARAAKAAAPRAAPAPAPAYSGQVPARPAPISAAPAKKSSKTLLIIIAVILVLCICTVAAFLYFAPCSFWLNIPFIPWGACPA